jgi:hypothetical protein
VHHKFFPLSLNILVGFMKYNKVWPIIKHRLIQLKSRLDKKAHLVRSYTHKLEFSELKQNKV